jgi:tryptophanyl-tRNA synthetase
MYHLAMNHWTKWFASLVSTLFCFALKRFCLFYFRLVLLYRVPQDLPIQREHLQILRLVDQARMSTSSQSCVIDLSNQTKHSSKKPSSAIYVSASSRESRVGPRAAKSGSYSLHDEQEEGQ